MNSNSEDCTDGIHPFVLTAKAWNAQKNYSSGGGDCHGCNDFHDCCWLCFPFTIAIDLATLVPFAGFYLGKKCSKKCCKKHSVIPPVTPIFTQPAKMPTPIQ